LQFRSLSIVVFGPDELDPGFFNAAKLTPDDTDHTDLKNREKWA
jgi:hypothetical protein